MVKEMVKDRDEFLQQLWQAYPAFPKGFDRSQAKRFGQVLEQAFADRIQISPSLSPVIMTLSEVKKILDQQDLIVSRSEAGKITEIFLLAPALAAPLELNSSPEIQRKWFEFLDQIKKFFGEREFHQAGTPTLVECPGTEPFLDLFSTEMLIAGKAKKMYLPTSPEIHLKKMLAAGYRNVFEIKNCFRNGEVSQRHLPEFTMLEWYRSYSDLEEIVQDCLDLICYLRGEKIKFHRKTMAQIFKEKLQFDLTPQTTIQELKILAKQLDLAADNFELWDDVFYFIFIKKIENSLESEIPLILEKYPPSQAAFARLTSEGWGDRFEIYWKGLEIGNAFHELNDPRVQSERFHEDLEKKRKLGKEIPALDDQFMQALQSGMPPSAGIAVGLERLFMALNGISDISELKVF